MAASLGCLRDHRDRLDAACRDATQKISSGGPAEAEPPLPPITFSVAASDQLLSYPSGMTIIPDEHTTVVPIRRAESDRARGRPGDSYRLFIATNNQPGAPDVATGVLQSDDLVKFELAPGYGDRSHGSLVMWSPSPFQGCDYELPTLFDQNYAAPGSVVRDPTLPEGNLIMAYEAEQHCPGGPGSKPEFNYWASVGLARSSDDGKTWPKPRHYGDDRYAILQIPGKEPSTPHPAFGDAIPSAFVDDVKAEGEGKDRYLYVTYYFNGTPSTATDGLLRVARARLGGKERLQFKKWFVDPVSKKGGWTQDGIGGSDSGVTPTPGCGPAYFQFAGQISFNDALRVYMLTFMCITTQLQSDGSYKFVEAGWYYSTAASLENQQWSSPQLMVNSQKPVTGWNFDGWYPSFISPGCDPGHLGLSGRVFLLNGSPIGARTFASRQFAITGVHGKPLGREACGERDGVFNPPR